MGLWCEADGPVKTSVTKLTPTVPGKEPTNDGGNVQTPAQGDPFSKFKASDVTQTCMFYSQFLKFCILLEKWKIMKIIACNSGIGDREQIPRWDAGKDVENHGSHLETRDVFPGG